MSHLIECRFLPPTNTKPARYKLVDLHTGFNTMVTYNHSIGNITDPFHSPLKSKAVMADSAKHEYLVMDVDVDDIAKLYTEGAV